MKRAFLRSLFGRESVSGDMFFKVQLSFYKLVQRPKVEILKKK